MGKDSGKRATRKRLADVSAAAREDADGLERATTRRLARLEKDLAAARRTEDRHRSRLAVASAEAERIRSEIGGLVRHASEPAMGGARKVGHVAGDLIEDAADAVVDAAGAVRDAAGSVVGAARRAVRGKSARPKSAPEAPKGATADTAPAPAPTPTTSASPVTKPTTAAKAPKPKLTTAKSPRTKPTTAGKSAALPLVVAVPDAAPTTGSAVPTAPPDPATRAVRRPRRTRPATTPTPGPDNT
jgi:hypothetical protein